jgi:signal transduction histidine kinase
MIDLQTERHLHPYPAPMNEPARGRLLAALDLESRRDDPFFANVVEMAKGIFDAPVAFLSLISGADQRFLCVQGIDLRGTPRTHSMCAYTVAAKRTIVSGDTHDDPRFRDHPIVAEPPHVRFSASAPVILSDGFCRGTLCAIDLVPHDDPEPHQIEQLEHLAASTARFYEAPLEADPDRAAEVERVREEAQREFLALVSRELRTPLNGIVGLSHCLDARDDDERELHAALRDSAAHLDAIVHDVIEFSTLSAGDIALAEDATDLGGLARRAAASMSGLLRARGKAIHCEGLDPIPIRADDAKMLLALTCLLDNVVSHGGTTAWLEAGIAADGDAVLRLSDDGPGLSEARRQAIWRPLSVGEDLHTRGADGLGLGLPLTRRIVELHGGRIDIGAHPSGGLVATLRLPAWRLS